MKTFREQFRDCVDSGVCEVMDTQEEEVIYSILRRGPVTINRVHFCNKYMKRCGSMVCWKERLKQ
jgi:hypothetical protein